MKVSSTVLQTNRCGDARGLVQLQSWLKTDSIPEASAKKILGAAQRILAAGRSDSEKAELN